ncbi:MAG TPA: DUF2782 domain-containing protein [Rhodanobacteraceae bacterium]|nr:DUF2782 domain-containing protein [Rhodanobacteraceae bacterium]
MTRWCLIVPSVAALALAACASRPVSPYTGPEALPPPGMDDPGVQPAPAVSIPPLPGPRDANGDPVPTVTVRQEQGATVQEYRHNGRIYMIRITPAHGVTQTFLDTNGDGRLEPDPHQGPVAPVYYTLYQWD